MIKLKQKDKSVSVREDRYSQTWDVLSFYKPEGFQTTWQSEGIGYKTKAEALERARKVRKRLKTKGY